MIDRSRYFPIATIFIGLFAFSIGLNIVLLDKLNQLIFIVNTTNSPVDDQDLTKFMEEIKRLSKQTYINKTESSDIQYDVKTKQPIKNDFIYSAK